MSNFVYVGARMCPICGETSKVLESRERQDGSIWRKRICMSCKAKYTTTEKIEKILRIPKCGGQEDKISIK